MIMELRDYDPEIERGNLPKVSEDFKEKDGIYVPTYSGFQPAEATSAMQKAIRRRWYSDAYQWGLELYRTGKQLRTIAWNRLIIISFEDVGIADPYACLDVYELYQNKTESNFIKAIYRLCLAKKSRIADNAAHVYYHYNNPNKVFEGEL